MAEFCFLGCTSGSQMMGCIIKTASKMIVIDGGTCENATALSNIIMEQSQGHVDAWFFTHPHHDHIGAYDEIVRNNADIKIAGIYSCFPSKEELTKYNYRFPGEEQMWERFEDDADVRNHRIKAGEEYEFDDVVISVLRVYNPKITSNFCNNSSAVLRIDGVKSSVLILGDLGIEGGREVMDNVPVDKLKTDYVQLAHHGQNGVDYSFYQYIEPKKCLWATPEWLWNNDTGEGFDTGPFATIRTREWMNMLGVKEHIVGKDGDAKIEI